MNAYYFQQGQASSTSGGTGIKTLPESSKVETISEASLPAHSVTSQKEVAHRPKESLTPRLHQKTTIKLDRPREKNREKKK
jgi:hypothetical protein